jgi:hypothetical protein
VRGANGEERGLRHWVQLAILAGGGAADFSDVLRRCAAILLVSIGRMLRPAFAWRVPVGSPVRLSAAALLVAAVLVGEQRWAGVVESNGKPVPGAVVTAKQGTKSWSTSSDEAGRFEFVELSDGPFTLQIQMFGFQPFTKEVTAADRAAAPGKFALALRPPRPAGGPGRQAPGQQQESAVETEFARAEQMPVAPPAAEPGDSSEAFLVQGSMSRGLQQPSGPESDFGPGRGFGPDGPGGFGGPGGGFGGPGGGGPGFGGPGGGAPGFGGGGGGGGGGFGGGGRGGFGAGGGRGPGGPGGPGGPPNLANMSPEQREQMRRRFEEMRQQRGLAEGFGNRANRRARQEIRGSVFWSFRDSALDAKPYAVNGNTIEKPDYMQNRFGVNVGGPLDGSKVGLGKLFKPDNTFFFVNYTGIRGENPFTGFAVMPTDQLRAGNFSGLTGRNATIVYDPTTGLPFPGNQIPDDRINPTARALLNLIPKPNATGTLQNYKFVTSIPSDNDNLNVRLNRTLTKTDRLAYTMGWQRRESINAQLYGYLDPSNGSGQNHDLTWTHNFTPRLIMTMRARYNLNRNQLVPYFAYGIDYSGLLGITGNSREPVNYGPPNLNFTNFGDLTDGNHSNRRIHTWNFGNGWTIVRGKHSLTAGFDFTRLQWNTIAEQNARGTLFFGGLATSGFTASGQVIPGTGSDFADFLLGLPQQSSIRYGGADTYMRQSQYSAYFQDEWRVKPSLTLNLGVRYEDWEPFTEKYGRMANLALSPARNELAVVTPGSMNPWDGTTPDGLIHSDRNNFSPRVGLAWRPFPKRRTVVRAGYSLFYDGSIYSRIPGRLGAQPPFATSAQFNTSVENPLFITNPFIGPQDVTIRNSNAVNPAFRVPYAQTWNFSVQHELKRVWVVEAGYIGTKGTALIIQRLPNRAAPGSPATSEDRRPIPNAVGFTYDSPEGNSIYHALQMRLTKRMQKGISWNVLYTWSKSIDNASTIGGVGSIVVQDDNNLRAERGLSSFDRRHQLSFNGIFTSPFGPRGQYMRQKTTLSQILRDWNLTASMNANSGSPFTARVLGAAADSAGTGATGSARASVTGLPVDAGSGYFNTAAFIVPLSGTFGTAGRNTIPGPGFVTFSASFGRAFQVGDDSRRRLEIRAMADNFLNHVNITGIGTVVNAANYGLATSAGAMRSMQLMLRFRF